MFKVLDEVCQPTRATKGLFLQNLTHIPISHNHENGLHVKE